MRGFAVSSCLALAIAGWLAPAPSARAEGRNADAILKEINDVKVPQPDMSKVNDRTYVQKFIAERQQAASKRAELIGELYKVAPERSELNTLMPERWQALLQQGLGNAKSVKDEIAEVQHAAKSDTLKANASFYQALIALQVDSDSATAVKATEAFLKAAPKDPRAPMLLYQVASQIDDSGKQVELLKKLSKDYPNSPPAKMAEGTLKKIDAVGKPFELEFTDAIKGTEVSMKTLKGKVVVVDFWATWCGPCVAELPNMKKLYAEYKDKGVEFVGVSLDAPKDQGGLDKLKDFVAKNEITWPQYYQGNGWQSEFSSSWGINSIPAVFVVDADGKLASVNARGKLEKMIPDLLKKAKGKTDAGAGGN